jgi:hypothetical protein
MHSSYQHRKWHYYTYWLFFRLHRSEIVFALLNATWLDYLRSVTGTDPLIIVQSQCDKPESRADVPVRLLDWIGSSWTVEVSSRTDFGLEQLKATLKDAAWLASISGRLHRSARAG